MPLVQSALPAPVPEQLISTALTFLSSGYDPARRNAAQFLGIALSVRGMLAEFDRQGGPGRLLQVLRATLLLLRAPSAADARMDKQVRPSWLLMCRNARCTGPGSKAWQPQSCGMEINSVCPLWLDVPV